MNAGKPPRYFRDGKKKHPTTQAWRNRRYWREELRERLLHAVDLLEWRKDLQMKLHHALFLLDETGTPPGTIRRAFYPGGVTRLEQLHWDGRWLPVSEVNIE